MRRQNDLALTRAEEEIMQILWKIERGFIKDILDRFPDPKPAYNTVSTIVRILETKGFIDHKAYGKTHEYFPLVQKDEYTKAFLGNFLHNHFNNSFRSMVSFFAKSEEMDVKELEETLKMMQQEVEKHKKKKS